MTDRADGSGGSDATDGDEGLSPERGSIDPEALYERIEAGDPVSILDVRNRDEFEEWHIGGESVAAAQVPMSRVYQAEVTGAVADLAGDLDEPIVVVCARGEASAYVADRLTEAGVEAANLDAGMDGWARVYVAREIPHPEATVIQYDRPSSGCLSYLVVAGNEAVVIDPLRAFAGRYVADAADRGADIVYAVDTHVHADHVSGTRDVASLSGATVVVPDGTRERGLDFDADVRVETVGDAEKLGVGGAGLEAVYAPGHTSEMTAFRLGDLLFTGDSLLLESVARPDLESGDEGVEAAARRLYRTLRDRLFSLPPETRVAPAHRSEEARSGPGGYVATLGVLRERLPALSLDEETFVEYVSADVPPRPANYEEIIEINLGRRSVDEDEAFELEHGPNNCAVSRLRE